MPREFPPCKGCGRIRVVPPQTKCAECQGMVQVPPTMLWAKKKEA